MDKYEGCDCGGEHHTLGKRAWCLDCSEYCSADTPCEIAELRLFQARVRSVVERMAKQAPDSSQSDYDLWCELATVVLGHD